MNNDERYEYVKYRIESAQKTFSAAKVLSEKLIKKYGRLLSELFDWRQKRD